MTDGLLPTKDPAREVLIDRELPAEARAWGRIVDLSQLEPGDLILTRSVLSPLDNVSKGIVDAQIAGGLPPRHAQWTHAAVYLGDDEHVCEASFKFPGYEDDVTIRSTFTYCNGQYALRARRPKNMTSKQRLRIAIGALANLNKRYGYGQIWTFFYASKTGKGFWSSADRRPRIRMNALVCSTLYQDAYNFAFKGATIRLGSLCTPAHLSASDDFEAADIPMEWLGIK